jgi:tRNA threonylcarbamoyladenosine biosynthesis protein TsaB
VSVLAIDTASRSRVVVVVATAGGVVSDAEVVRGQAVGTSLPRMLARALETVDGAVVVVTGPGTYTGVRAGMASALGVAQARRLPLHGIGSLEVAACADIDGADGADRTAWVVADAGRGALYVARRTAAGAPRRIEAAAFRPGPSPVVSTEPLPIDGLVLVDPAAALAAAIPLALSRAPLEPAGLTALYVD